MDKMAKNVYWRKVGTAAYERPLLGMISMGTHVSVKALAQATNTSTITVTRQLYWWAFCGQNLKLLHKVNWKWNKQQTIPEHYLREFEQRPIDREQKFKNALVRELHRQATVGCLKKIKVLTDVLVTYS
jgi:hypothetical protein